MSAAFALGLLSLGFIHIKPVLLDGREPDIVATIVVGGSTLLGVFLSVISWRLLSGKGASRGGIVLSPAAWRLTGLVFFGLAGPLLWAGGARGAILAAVFGILCFTAANFRARLAQHK